MPAAPRLSASLYTDLAKQVRESGLMRRRYGCYWTRITITVAGFAAIWVGVVLLGDSWWQLLLAAALGFTCTQFGFLGHDAAHRQMFVSSTWNDWMSRILASGLRRALPRLVEGQAQPPPRQPEHGVLRPGHRPRRARVHPARRCRPDARLRPVVPGPAGLAVLPAVDARGTQPPLRGTSAGDPDRAPPWRRTEIVLVAVRLVAYVVLLSLLLPPGLAARSSSCRWRCSGCASVARSPPATRACRSCRAR